VPAWHPDFNPRIDTRHPKLVELAVEVEALKRSVLKIPLPPFFQKKYDQMNIVRQIRGTTGIEGNALDEDKIADIVARVDSSGQVRVADPEAAASSGLGGARLEEQEVLNAERVLRFLREEIARQGSAQVSEDIIRAIHRLTTSDCGYQHNGPGQYRRHEVEVGEYRPPKHEQVPDLMKQFVSFINSREAIEGYKPIIRAILAHFYLLSIHPFGDGNGRTARALEAYILLGGGYNVRGFYSLANFLYRNRVAYVDALQAARFRQGGDLTGFVLFALSGLVSELQTIQDEILAFLRSVLFRDLGLRAFREGKISPRAWAIVEYLNSDAPGGVSQDQFRARQHHLAEGLYAGLSAKTMARDLAALSKAGLIAVRDGNLVANLDLLS
jgi:Fic family protein